MNVTIEELQEYLPHLHLDEIDEDFDIDYYEPEVLALAQDLEEHPDNIEGEPPNLSCCGHHYLVATEDEIEEMCMEIIRNQAMEHIDLLPDWISVHIDIDHAVREAYASEENETLLDVSWENSISIDGEVYQIYKRP